MNSFIPTAKRWIDAIGAIGPISKSGRYGGTHADEADLLNVALFGRTAKGWRDAHPDAEDNMRDHASLEQLVVLTNLESFNSVLIRRGLP